MKYDFDEIVDRYNTQCIKYDFAAERGKPEGLIPLWVADMDFRTAPCITDAIHRAAEHAVFGYSDTKKDGGYVNALQNWFEERFHFTIKPDWLVKTPGVVYALCTAVKAFTEPNESVLIQPPVYYPFRMSVEINQRRLVTNPLVYANGRYEIDFEDFENKIVEQAVKLFILCSPHNPIGRVWTKDELTRLGTICQKHNVIVIADEIHCDFVFAGHQHTVFGTISEAFLNNSMICTSPSKTFNLAGLQTANMFIADAGLRRRFKGEIAKTGYSQLNSIGLAACQAAYTGGGEWLGELLTYLAGNYAFAKEYIESRLPKIRLGELEGTYLHWLDLNEYGFSESELDRLLVHKAGLWVDNGSIFGEEGNGFIRINAACPRNVLKKALDQLAAALELRI